MAFADGWRALKTGSGCCDRARRYSSRRRRRLGSRKDRAATISIDHGRRAGQLPNSKAPRSEKHDRSSKPASQEPAPSGASARAIPAAADPAFGRSRRSSAAPRTLEPPPVGTIRRRSDAGAGLHGRAALPPARSTGRTFQDQGRSAACIDGTQRRRRSRARSAPTPRAASNTGRWRLRAVTAGWR